VELGISGLFRACNLGFGASEPLETGSLPRNHGAGKAGWVGSVSKRFDLTDRVAIVTGGTRGIGLAIARGLKECGAKVAISDMVDRGLDRAEGFHFIQCDNRKPDEITGMVEQIADRFGRIDILVNNAAMGARKPVIEMSVEEWEEVLRINVTGTFLVSKEVGKVMLKQKKGSIINLGSNYGSVGVSDFSAYCVSKAAVIQLSRVLAVEWAREGVRVNTISPSATRTERTRERLDDPKLKAHYEHLFPVGRVLETDDLVGAAIFLASDASEMVTGHNLNVDGGYLSRGEF
jgi:NAD(P)-dependent dehydrogenase (short-subunit alcohol dehydrogenase family)